MANVEALVREAQDGNRDACGELVRRFYPTVRAICRRHIRTASRRDDAIQNVFLLMIERIGQLQEPARFAGWLKQIAFHQSIRPPKGRGMVCLDADPVGSDRLGPLDSLLLRDQLDRIRNTVGRLKPIHRDVLVAFYFRNQSLIEISNDFDVPIGTVKQRLWSAKKWLKAELECQGISG
jgi:RNA polymerase sigma-70 factor (ECF subfamily)